MTEIVTSKPKVKWKKAGNFLAKQALIMFAQLIPVAVGVYLGIVASDWNAEQKQRAAQKEFLNNLHLELLSNKMKVEKAVAYHAAAVANAENLQKSLNQETLNKGFWAAGGWGLLQNWQGVQVPTLESSVYQTGIIGNTLSGLDFKTINTIAQVYNYQADYKPLSEKLFTDKIVNLEGDESASYVLGNFGWLKSFVEIEKELLYQYDISLKHLKGKAATL
ncbi:hypothetical protein [Rhodocytophaga aerolata]